MSTRQSARSARNNTLILHLCKACGAKWENIKRMSRCPKCHYTVPRGVDKEFHVIETMRVNLNKDGRIICHVAKES